MKVLVDMNLSPRWVGLLSEAGFEAVHWSNIGIGDAPDPEIMHYALQYGYTVLTNDLDFGILLAATKGRGPSVVQLRGGELSSDVIGTKVVRAIRQMITELEDGALLTFDTKRIRLSLLPLRE